jgi:predicted Zn-dependent peptidase
VPVYFLENHEYPTILLIGYIETGRMEEENLHPGIRQMTEALMVRGTAKRTYEELLEERSFTPYQIDISQSWNKIIFQGYGLLKTSIKSSRPTLKSSPSRLSRNLKSKKCVPP